MDRGNIWIERAAEAIYARFNRDDGTKPAWVSGGNSEKQDEARRYAHAALETVLSPNLLAKEHG